MSRPLEIPTAHLAICDTLIAHALGKGPEPKESQELKEFQEWLLYSSGAMSEDDFDCVVHLSRLEFEDDQVRSALGLNDDAPISDEQRLSHARHFIDTYGEDGSRDPYFAESFELPAPTGSKAVYCCLTQAGGHSVILANWYGCFPDKASFLNSLCRDGYWVIGDPTSEIPDSTLLGMWYQPGQRS